MQKLVCLVVIPGYITIVRSNENRYYMFTYLFIQDALHAFTLVFTFQTFADIVINSHECKITSPPFPLDELPLTGNFCHLKHWFFFIFRDCGAAGL